MKRLICLVLVLLALGPVRAELSVPAYTAYLDPDANGARVAEQTGIAGWRIPGLQVRWFSEIKTPGNLICAVQLRLLPGHQSKLGLTVADISRGCLAARGWGSTARAADKSAERL